MKIAIGLSVFFVAVFCLTAATYSQNFNLPWCTILDNDGNLSCAYYTKEQCLETLSGVGGECVPNPSAGTPPISTVPNTTMPPLQLLPGATPPGGVINPGPPPD